MIRRISSDGAACGPPSVECDGGFERYMYNTTNGISNVIPQEANVLLEYDGDLLPSKWISLVATHLASDPCAAAGIAAAVADNLHSGVVQGTGVGGVGSGKVVNIPQDIAARVLDSTRIYAVCYSATGPSNTDTWINSGIEIRISKLSYVTAYDTSFRTDGTIPNCGASTGQGACRSLTMRYYGSILNDRWMSLVDSTLNEGRPCELGYLVGAGSGTAASSGSLAGTGNAVRIDTAALSGTIKFAVCYAESGGIQSSTWRDSGIRLMRSKVTSIKYGVDTAKFGQSFERVWLNRHTDMHMPIPTDQFPRTAGAELEYVGEMLHGNHLSLVDDSLGFGHPCRYPQIAAGAAAGGGSSDARVQSGVASASSDSSKVVIAQSAGNLLDASKRYAVCYADGDGTTSDSSWADSYVRVGITLLESVVHHSAMHGTTGMLPNTGDRVDDGGRCTGINSGECNLKLKFTGSLGVVDTFISIVEEQRSAISIATSPSGSMTAYVPCNGTTDSDHSTSNDLYSGIIGTSATVSNSGNQYQYDYSGEFLIDSRQLHTGTITAGTPATLTRTVFGVCYKDGTAGEWRDSGIRLTVGKLQDIKYGVAPASGTDPYAQWVMKPVTTSLMLGASCPDCPESGLSNARNVIPQVAGESFTYVSNSGGGDEGIQGTALVGGEWISLVDATLNSNKPCVLPATAAATADSSHSGVMQTAFSSTVTIPQATADTLLGHDKVFAVCYAVVSGSVADTTWADSYVRLTISQVQSVSSIGVTHRVNNYIATIAHRTATAELNPFYYPITVDAFLDLRFQGSLASSANLALMDHTTGSPAHFPCTSLHPDLLYNTSNSGLSSGSLRSTDSVVRLTTSNLWSNRTYALCYSVPGSSAWYETGIRVERSKVASVNYDMDAYSNLPRIMTSLFFDTNLIPQEPQMLLTYTGDLEDYKGLSLVDSSQNNGNPCVDGSIAAAAANAGGSSGARISSGVDTYPDTLRTINIYQAPTNELDAELTFAVCYSETQIDDAAAAYNWAWRDSYIRLRVSKLYSLSQNLGEWPTVAGKTITHKHFGQLPYMAAGETGLDVTLAGTLASDSWISLVDSSAASTQTVVHGVTYYHPCTTASFAGALADSTHSGAVRANSSIVNTLDSTNLNPDSKTYALCYAEGGVGAATGYDWRDSGIRFTFSKIQRVEYSSGHSGTPDRSIDSVFRMTNRLPQMEYTEIAYVGAAAGPNLWFSIVRSNDDASDSTHKNNPCVDTTYATAANSGGATNSYSMVMTGGGSSGYDLTLQQLTSQTTLDYSTTSYNHGFTYALCYSEFGDGSSESHVWVDSYIRLQMSMIASISSSGIKHQTTGQIPNVFDSDSYRFYYNSELSHSYLDEGNAWLALVDQTMNDQVPCVGSIAGKSTATSSYTGSHRSYQTGPSAYEPYVSDFDTNSLDVSKEYALCYASSTDYTTQGGESDTTWADSGIRLTLPKLHTVLYKSGYEGPAYTVGDTYSGDSKLDSKPREMTSFQLATNTLPADTNQELEYVGALPAGNWISVVAADLNSANPCVKPSIAAHNPNSDYSGAVQATGRVVVIPQTTARLLQEAVYAVCYSDGDGSTTDYSWRDSYIRLKITRITSFDVKLSQMPVSNDFATVPVRTYGQLPAQQPNQQVSYEYSNPDLFATQIPGIKWIHISLVDATLNQVVNSVTGLTSANPCQDDRVRHEPADATCSVEDFSTASDCDHSGFHKSSDLSTAFRTLDTTKLNSDSVYAVCYSDEYDAALDSPLPVNTPGWRPANWTDSGIRVTTPAVHTIHYMDLRFGNPTVFEHQTRKLTSLVSSVNTLPSPNPTLQVTYEGKLSDNNYLSLVDAALNSNNPCVNPADAGAANIDSSHSGVFRAGSGDSDVLFTSPGAWTYPLGISNNHPARFAICYASSGSGDSVPDDNTWRDSYVRVTLSQIEHIVSYQVTHRVKGQIPNHPELKINYQGYLPDNKFIALIDDTLEPMLIGETSSPYPCTQNNASFPAQATYAADQGHTGPLQAGTSHYATSKVVQVDTTNLNPERTFALCYSDGASCDTGGDCHWYDSGIRLTTPQIINLKLDSGWSGITNAADGIPARQHTSWDQISGTEVLDRPTSRLPQLDESIMFEYETANNANPDALKGALFAFVDVSVDVVGGYGLQYNPCVKAVDIGSEVVREPQTDKIASNVATERWHSGVIQALKYQDDPNAADEVGNIVTVPESELESGVRVNFLDPSKIYAVCYRVCIGNTIVGCDNDPDCQCNGPVDIPVSGVADAPSWQDSYIRLQVTKVKSIIAVGVTHRTVGQIHSMTPVSSRSNFDGVYVEYQGALSESSWISLVDDTLNPQANGEGYPCEPLYATAISPATSYTGGKQAPSTGASGDDKFRIRQLDTRSLDTNKTFAVCYSADNTNWLDSGIRVTVSAVHTVQYSSGHAGPIDKPETMARSMTCVPASDNRLPQEANYNLTYLGDMLAHRWISLVDASLNDGNPCVSGGTAAALGASGGDMAQYSGPSLDATGTKSVTVVDSSEAASGNLLRADGTFFAVCYDAGYAPVFTYSPQPVSGTVGTTSSTTWRDSYIRLKITKLTSLEVQIPVDPATSTFSKLTILTFGQIPNTPYDGQISYSYTGTVLGNTYISLVDVDARFDNLHGVQFGNPCELADRAKTEPTGGAVAGEDRYSGVSNACGPMEIQAGNCAAGNNDKVVRIDSTTPYLRNVSSVRGDCDNSKYCQSPGLSPQLLYAVCYSATNSNQDSDWFDSGIRVSPTWLTGVDYFGDPVTLPKRKRSMNSRGSALHRLPQARNQKLIFTGPLPAGSWVSLVDSTMNSGFYSSSPCANPEIAAAPASQYQSGPLQSDGNGEFIIPQDILLAKTSVFAVCYSDSGTTTDNTWKESYIRLSISSVETVSAVKVFHRTTGQLPDHAALELAYQGSLVNSSYISLVDSTLNLITTATSEYASSGFVTLQQDSHPCQSAAYTEHAASSNLTGTLTASGTQVTFDSQNLNREGSRKYAVCYAAADSSSLWEDTGIRVTFSAVTELLYASGHSGPVDKPDTMPRHMSSEPLAINRLPRYSQYTLTYVTHDLSSLAGDAGREIFLSIVASNLNDNNPCVLGTYAAEDPLNSGTSNARLHTGASRAKDLTKDVPYTSAEWQGTGNLLAADTEFAVCYATDDGSTTDTSWQDSYIRLFTSEIYSFSALGVTHLTLGQIPWSPASDQLEYQYAGSLSATARLSLVDASLNGGHPCASGADAAHAVDGSGLYSGWHQASGSTVTALDTTVLDPAKQFALCYSTTSQIPGWYLLPGQLYQTYMPGTWYDSGIRLTVPKMHSVQLHSGYTEPGQWASRIMTSFPHTTNRLARAEDQTFEYTGTLADGSVISMVDALRNDDWGFGYNPCVNPAYAAAATNFECESNDCPNARHYTGAINATGRQFSIPQQIASENLLFGGTYGEREYAVCYAEGSGGVDDNTWRDSYIRLKTSEIESFSVKGVTHRTEGQLPHHAAGIEYTMAGQLVEQVNKWVSLVLYNTTIMSGGASDYFGRPVYNPCGSPSQADHVADEHHTVKSMNNEAGGDVIDTMDTTGLSKTSLFALCYSNDALEQVGSPHWFDSGIRLTVSKLSAIEYSGYGRVYAEAHGKPHRLIQSIESGLQNPAEIVPNVLPQMTDMPLVYVGNLGVSNWIALVAVKDTAEFNNLNPCVDATLSGALSDGYRSGASRGCSGGNCDLAGAGASVNGNKEVIVAQSPHMLDSSEMFTVCYSDGDGSASDTRWRDSYIRVSISKVQSITTDGVLHFDHGQIADYDYTVPLQLQYNGSTADGIWFSLVNEVINNNNPCEDGVSSIINATSNETTGATLTNATIGYWTVAAATPSANSSGSQQAVGSVVPIDTSMLSTDVQFAVCYAESTGFSNDSTWRDSGIRVTKSAIHTLRYNEGQTPVNQFRRSITAGRAFIGSGKYLQELNHLTVHKLPQPGSASASSNVAMSYLGDAGGEVYLSIVDASFNNYEPCVLAAVAGHVSSASHSGPIYSSADSAFNLSNAILNQLSVTSGGSALTKYALCYNPVHGGDYDFPYSGMGKLPVSWQDSYVRFEISQIETVTNHQVVHRTQGHIANHAAFGLTYSGSLAANMWLSLVDDFQGGSGERPHNVPCLEASWSASNYHTGPTQAESGTRRVVLDTTDKSTMGNFAVCYSSNNVDWYDSGIRVTLAAVTTISFNEEQPVAVTGSYLRKMSSQNTYPATDALPVGTNRLPRTPVTPLTFYGNVVPNPAGAGESIGKETFFSFVDSLSNAGNPCADQQVAGQQTPTTRHSGVMKEQSGFIPLESRELNFTQLPLIDAGMISALCYATGEYNTTSDGTPLDGTWRDTYIRVQFTRVSGLTSYGVTHVTTGMVASKPALRVAIQGTLAGGALALIDASLNSHQPCVPAYASVSPSTADEELQYSGVSSDVSVLKHTLQTDKLSAAAELALCYAEGTGDASDLTWSDSGMRLYTPKVTMLSYSAPARVITAESCFGDVDLYGAASCLKHSTCTGGSCEIHSNSTSCGPDGSVDCPLIPRHTDTTLIYSGPQSISVPTGLKMSLVEHTRGEQANNPCRDAVEASALADAFGTVDNRLHSGVIAATAGTTTFVVPQGATNLLNPDDTYAVCYTEGDGSDTDAGWRDSYIRLRLSKIANILASDISVTTRGLLANVPSLRIDWYGSLGFNKHISVVDITENSGVPCDNAYAGATSHPTGLNSASGKVQADAGGEVVWIDATDLNGNGNMYTVCYSDSGGGTSDDWIDSGLRLGFVKWTNPSKSRLASGSASKLKLQLNFAQFDVSVDKAALLKDATDCSAAMNAPVLSDGDSVMRSVTSGYDGEITLPSGTGVTDVNADGWLSCREHVVEGGTNGITIPAQVCPSTGAYGDDNLNVGTFLICVCLESSGDGGCDSPNEWLKVGSPINSAGVKIVGTPWVGRWQDLAGSHIDNLRSITGESTVYSITGTKSAGFEIANGDQLFFSEGACDSIPLSNTSSYTSTLTLTMFDPDTGSATYGTARITLPSNPPLTDDNGELRTLVTCFATSEGVDESPAAHDYVMLSDGLEVMPYPLLGPALDVKAVSGSAPSFKMDWLRHGDRVFFVETAESKGDYSDCYEGGTTLLAGSEFDSLTDPTYPTGKLTLPSDTYLESYAAGPRFLTTCFIPAGAAETLFSGSSCPVTDGTETDCGQSLVNVVRLAAQLHIFPEPIQALQLSWNQGLIHELKFNKPQWGVYGDRNYSTGLLDDIVVLKQDDCVGVHEVANAEDYFFGTTYSAKMLLQDVEGFEAEGSQQLHVRDEGGGALKTGALAVGKVNELAAGIYKICFASSSSEANDQEDFKQLSVEIEILERDAYRPTLVVPRSILLGQEVPVDWISNMEGPDAVVAAADSWIGLFRAGECNAGGEWQHQCYVASKAVTQSHLGESASRRVTFVFEEYKQAGEYDVRYFSGDTYDGQGRSCGGLQQSPHDTYVRCVLEAAVISETFLVQPKMKQIQNLDAIPGLEVVFEGSNRGRYAN